MRRLLCATLVCMFAAANLRVTAQSPSLEYDVKAAFLLNFARYVEWPPVKRSGQVFTLCVLEPDPFGARLDAAVAGERWEGRDISVRRLGETRDVDGCHLLYVPAAAASRYNNARAQIGKMPLLTVGEVKDFSQRGGIIQLFVEENRVKFSINEAAADSAGLRISSRLLRLAREVLPKQGKPQ